MDSLNYNYYKGTNQLRNVRDGVSATNYSNNIDDEPSIYNYRYNGIGQLAKDSAGGIDSIYWNVYGKVQQINFNLAGGYYKSLYFVYDPLGNRLEKIEKLTPPCPPYPMPCFVTPIYDTTKYVRDAQGNILAVYHRKNDTVHLIEWDIYGSKRIGVVDTNLLVYEPVPVCPLCPIVTNTMDSATTGYLEGQKQYELTNHLGNVLVTVSDKVTPVDTLYSVPHIADYYEAVIINAQDYYPFGMVEPGRQYAILHDSSYHYAFNGKPHDDDIYGKDNSYDYGMRMYDPRLGRFMSTDPLYKKYPMLSTYQFASNTPIQATDLDGKEAQSSIYVAGNFNFNFGTDKIRAGVGIQVNDRNGQTSAAINITNDNENRNLSLNAYVNANAAGFISAGTTYNINGGDKDQGAGTLTPFVDLISQNVDIPHNNPLLLPTGSNLNVQTTGVAGLKSDFTALTNIVEAAANSTLGQPTPTGLYDPINLRASQQSSDIYGDVTGASNTSQYSTNTLTSNSFSNGLTGIESAIGLNTQINSGTGNGSFKLPTTTPPSPSGPGPGASGSGGASSNTGTTAPSTSDQQTTQ